MVTSLFFCQHSLRKLEKKQKTLLATFLQKEKCGPFILHRMIAQGGFGAVYEVYLAGFDKHRFAAKLLPGNLNDDEMHPLINEVNILRMLNHKHIVQVYDLFYLEREKVHVLLQELVKGQDLFYWSQKQEQKYTNVELYPLESLQERLYIFRDIVLTVQYLYEKHIYHRDIKLENILYVEKEKSIKICDFGLAVYSPKLQDWRQTRCCGSPHYVSPEILRGKGYMGEHALVWSLGILFYILIGRRIPFNALTEEGKVDIDALAKVILKGEYELLNVENLYEVTAVNEMVDDFVANMLCMDVRKRVRLTSLLDHTLFTPILSRTPVSLVKTVLSETMQPSRTFSSPSMLTLERLVINRPFVNDLGKITIHLLQETEMSTFLSHLLSLSGTIEYNVYEAVRFHYNLVKTQLWFVPFTKSKCQMCRKFTQSMDTSCSGCIIL